MRLKFLGMGICLMALLGMAPVMAAVVGYTDKSAFLVDAVGTKEVTNFDSATPGTVFLGAPGFSVSANSMVVVDPYVQTGYWTTSSNNYLGLIDTNGNDGLFYGGDSLTFNFSGSVRALGLYVITGSGTLAGDLELSSGGDTVFNIGTAAAQDDKGSFAFFLGLVSDADLSSITLNIGANVWGPAVDDVTLFSAGGGGDVPEPGTLVLIGMAALAAAVVRRRQAQSATSFNSGSVA
jgi:hypothetical protein